MGFLDHLFKLKQSDEKMGEGERGTAGAAGGNGEHAGAVPDPGAFLHPKDFGPRGGSLYPPIRPAPPVAKTPPPQRPGHEIVLTLGDVLSRIPTQLLRAGFHDANRELRFSIDDLSSDIARGRAAVPLSKIAALCPDVFAQEIAPGDDSEIRLPLQKLVEQIGLLRARPAMPPPQSTAPPPPEPPAASAVPETAPAKDSPPPNDEPSPAPPALDPPALETAAEPPAMSEPNPPPPIEPVASELPVMPVFTPPPPPIIAEPATEAPSENHVRPPAANTAPAAPTSASDTPAASIHIHPPPVVRPVLVLPPTLLAVPATPPAPLVSINPDPPLETTSAPEARRHQPSHFPQETLQALFMTDELLDLAAVCRHAAALPGIRACVLEWRGEKVLAGNPPAGFDLASLQAAAARMPNAESLPIGALENCTLHGDQAAISIFARPGLLLGVLHRALPPGVRERLATIAAELARPQR